MNKQIILYVSLLLVALTGCEKIVDLEIPSVDSKLVIEGQITNIEEPWVVRLALSQEYFNQDSIEPVSNALVTISGTDGLFAKLSHSHAGIFTSSTAMQCVPGEIYTLKILYNGEEYIASEILANGFPIDLIESYYLPENNGFIEAGYYVFIQGKENEYDGDSYLWNFWRNDTIQDQFGIVAENDAFGQVTFLNPNIDPDDPLKGIENDSLPRPFPFKLELNDTVIVDQYNLSPRYFQYLFDLQAQLGRSGSPFDPPPANPNNNISNGGLGYFSVAHFTSASIIIEE